MSLARPSDRIDDGLSSMSASDPRQSLWIRRVASKVKRVRYMPHHRLQKIACAVALCLGPTAARAIEPRLPPPYLYTVGQLYSDFVVADRARQLASQIKSMTVPPDHDDRSERARAYVAGVTDALNDKLFCAPPGSDIGGIVKLYLEGHTALWDKPASLAVEWALMEKFPCQPASADRASHAAYLLKYERH